MEGKIEFDEENNILPSKTGSIETRRRGLTSWIVKMGLAKNERKATVALAVLSVILIFITVVVFLTNKSLSMKEDPFSDGDNVLVD